MKERSPTSGSLTFPNPVVSMLKRLQQIWLQFCLHWLILHRKRCTAQVLRVEILSLQPVLQLKSKAGGLLELQRAPVHICLQMCLSFVFSMSYTWERQCVWNVNTWVPVCTAVPRHRGQRKMASVLLYHSCLITQGQGLSWSSSLSSAGGPTITTPSVVVLQPMFKCAGI